MKKIVQLFLKIGLFFLGLVVVVYVIGLPFGSLEKYGYHYQYVQPKLSTYQQEKPFSKEILFVGDSLAWTGFNPKGYEKEFGIKNYNLSTIGQMTLDSYVMIREALKTQKPKIIVLEAHALFNATNKYNRFDLMNLFPIMNYHAMYRFDLKGKEDPHLGYYPDKTIEAYRKRMDYMKQKKIPFNPLNPYNITYLNRFNLKYLDKIKKLCHDSGVKLVLVSVPSPVNWNQKRHDEVEKWANQNGIRYIDYNLKLKQVKIDFEKDYRDGGDHLNDFGEEKIRKALGSYLVKELERGQQQ